MQQSLKRKIKNINTILLIVLTVFVSISSVHAQEEVQKNQLKFGRLLRLLDGYYVDTVDVDKLTADAVVKVLSELDPHSVYISREEVEKMNEPLKGNFEGIGISFNIFKDTLLVLTTIPGGPSEKVGLQAGDRIVVVDGKNIAGIGLKNSDVFDMLRGEKGTKVELKVLRKPANETLDFTIVRDKIPIYSLDAYYMLDNNTGYIKLNKFSATTTDEFITAMNKLKPENIKNLILDLRGNGGGYLKTAIEISDQFLGDDQLVVFTNGRNDPKREYNSTSRGTFQKGKLVVLVDESSASASEIVSGAIQDWDRGIIVGRRSFGKGLVQKPFFLTDGSMIRLTTAHYYTPSGRCIQKPYDEGIKAYRQDFMNRMSHGELFSADSITVSDSLAYKTLINDRTVYGGGGIIPDIFVPMDTSSNYAYYNRLRRNFIVNNFVLGYVDKNREELKTKYPDFEDYNRNFEVSAAMIDTVVTNGVKAGIEKDAESLKYTKESMKRDIKALIARDIFTRNDFYKIIQENDKVIEKALEVIDNQKEYNNLLVSTD